MSNLLFGLGLTLWVVALVIWIKNAVILRKSKFTNNNALDTLLFSLIGMIAGNLLMVIGIALK